MDAIDKATTTAHEVPHVDYAKHWLVRMMTVSLMTASNKKYNGAEHEMLYLDYAKHWLV